jgi:hypothetical protein
VTGRCGTVGGQEMVAAIHLPQSEVGRRYSHRVIDERDRLKYSKKILSLKYLDVITVN